MVNRTTPKRPLARNLFWAFVVGGSICLVGQVVLAAIVAMGDLTPKEASTPTVGVMIFLGALFTGLGLYDRLAPLAGMGANLPITGFANSMVSPAMEFRREGFVLGVSARMFTVAGPVIVHAVTTAVMVGFIQYVLGK
ncbi:MAG: stage V sporulation protein AC [Bacillota bacterium]